MFLLSYYFKISKFPGNYRIFPPFRYLFASDLSNNIFLLASATVVESFEKDFSTLMELVKETQFTWSTTAVISC